MIQSSRVARRSPFAPLAARSVLPSSHFVFSISLSPLLLYLSGWRAGSRPRCVVDMTWLFWASMHPSPFLPCGSYDCLTTQDCLLSKFPNNSSHSAKTGKIRHGRTAYISLSLARSFVHFGRLFVEVRTCVSLTTTALPSHCCSKVSPVIPISHVPIRLRLFGWTGWFRDWD